MITYLSGTPKPFSLDQIIVLTHGVGYGVFLPGSDIDKVLQQAQVELYIHTAVREDAITLYGFTTLAQLRLYQTFLAVSGIGPKTALEIISGRSVAAVEQAVRQADVAFFTQIKGIGKKGAQRIIVELKDKLGSIIELDLTGETQQGQQDLLDALVSLGYSQEDAYHRSKQVDASLSLQDQIKAALRSS